MQHTEIERKFLVRSDGWRGKGNAKKIRQGYIARFQNRTVRVRLEGERGVLNIKYRNGGISRSEFEYEIPPVRIIRSTLPQTVAASFAISLATLRHIASYMIAAYPSPSAIIFSTSRASAVPRWAIRDRKSVV